MLYLFAKALHVVGFVSWFAGLLYVVRLFVYDVEAGGRPEAERRVLREQLRLMQRRLWYGIAWPAMAIEGRWRTYSLTLAWSPSDETLRLVCAFEMAPPARRLGALYKAMALANDKSWSGAFVLWPEQKLMVYRYSLNCAGGASSPDG